MTMVRRSAPMMILSFAFSKSPISTVRPLRRAANNAASFTRLARSAPEKPGVPRASTVASTSVASGTLRMCTFRICSRPRISGRADRKSTRLNSSHVKISYAVFCLLTRPAIHLLSLHDALPIYLDGAAATTRGKQRRLIHQIGQVGTRETRGTACQYRRVDISSQRHLAHVHFQDLLTAADIGQG